MNSQYTDKQILAAAKAAHECTRAFCLAIGDNTQVPWEWVEQQQRESYIHDVLGVASGDIQVASKGKDHIYITVVKAVLETFDREPGV